MTGQDFIKEAENYMKYVSTEAVSLEHTEDMLRSLNESCHPCLSGSIFATNLQEAK